MLRNFFLEHATYIHSAIAGIIRRAERNTKRLLGEVELPQSAREKGRLRSLARNYIGEIRNRMRPHVATLSVSEFLLHS